MSIPVLFIESLEVEAITWISHFQLPEFSSIHLSPLLPLAFLVPLLTFLAFLCTAHFRLVPGHWSHVSNNTYNFLMVEMHVC